MKNLKKKKKKKDNNNNKIIIIKFSNIHIEDNSQYIYINLY